MTCFVFEFPLDDLTTPSASESGGEDMQSATANRQLRQSALGRLQGNGRFKFRFDRTRTWHTS